MTDDRQKAESQWVTPSGVAEQFLTWCRIGDKDIVLGPSAGEGALVPNRPGVIAFEKDGDLVEELRYWRPHASVVNYDFLEATPFLRVDVTVGNMPFHDDGEGRFMRRSLDWSPRSCFLMRVAALQGESRYLKCWRFVQVDRLAVLVHRPGFLGPGNTPSPHSPAVAYGAFECSLRAKPLPEEGYNDFTHTIREFSFVDWR